jgi:hypothetical protein
MLPSPRIIISHVSEKIELAAKIREELEQLGSYNFFLSLTDTRGTRDWIVDLEAEVEKDDSILLALVTNTYFNDNRLSAREFRLFAEFDRAGRRLCIVRFGKAHLPRYYLNFHYITAEENDLDVKVIKGHLDDVIAIALRNPIQLTSYVRAAGMKIEYDAFLKSEFKEITARYDNPADFPLSRSRMVLYGWQSLQKLPHNGSDPWICFYLIRDRAESLRDEIYKNFDSNVIRSIVAIRFYLFCLCAILKIGPDDMEEIIQSYTHTLRQRRTDYSDNNRGRLFVEQASFERIIAQLKEERFHSEPETPATALAGLARISVGYGLTFDAIFKEDTSADRKERRFRHTSEIASRHAVTHRVTVYFRDRERNYFNILEKFNSMHLNLIRTETETLFPDRIARATLWVHYPEDGLKRSLDSLVKKSRNLNMNIFDLEVETAVEIDGYI